MEQDLINFNANVTEYEDLLEEDYELLEENLGIKMKVNIHNFLALILLYIFRKSHAVYTWRVMMMKQKLLQLTQ